MRRREETECSCATGTIRNPDNRRHHPPTSRAVCFLNTRRCLAVLGTSTRSNDGKSHNFHHSVRSLFFFFFQINVSRSEFRPPLRSSSRPCQNLLSKIDGYFNDILTIDFLNELYHAYHNTAGTCAHLQRDGKLLITHAGIAGLHA